MKRQRLTSPMVKDADGQLVEATWEEALIRVAHQLGSVKPDEIYALAGGLADAEVCYMESSN